MGIGIRSWLIAVTACSQFGLNQGSPEPVRFPSGDISLAGEIEFPPGSGPFPAVVLVHGSGPATRAGDAVAGLELLARHSRIDPTRLGLAGGSQAGWIIPNAAARFPVRFSVMLSGPLVSVGEENHFSRAFEGSTLPLDKVDSVMATFSGPKGYDPIGDILTMKGEAYWVLGGQDRSIPAVRSAQLADSLIRALNRPKWRALLLLSGDHSLFGPDGRSLDVFPPMQSWLDLVLR